MKEEKKERKEEKLVLWRNHHYANSHYPNTIPAPTILFDISTSPQENSNFKNPNFLEKISFQSSRFLKSIQ